LKNTVNFERKCVKNTIKRLKLSRGKRKTRWFLIEPANATEIKMIKKWVSGYRKDLSGFVPLDERGRGDNVTSETTQKALRYNISG
jgi:hypothetical protein